MKKRIVILLNKIIPVIGLIPLPIPLYSPTLGITNVVAIALASIRDLLDKEKVNEYQK